MAAKTRYTYTGDLSSRAVGLAVSDASDNPILFEGVRLVHYKDVAVNAYKVFTVPAAKTWVLGPLYAQLISAGAAENRQVVVDILDDSGTLQVETATFVEAVEGTSVAETINLTVTSAKLAGSPFTVAVTCPGVTTSSIAMATLCVAALNANVKVAALYTATQGTTAGALNATIILTAKDAVANDATLNVAIPAGTGVWITAAASSTNTTAGVAAKVIWHRLFTSVQAATLTYQYYASGDVTDAAVAALTNYMKMNAMILPPGFAIRVWNNTAYTNIHLDELDLHLMVDERSVGSRL
jgi:hypothetical protein